MLTDKERALLQTLDPDLLERDVLRIAEYERVSGSNGEKQAADYIVHELSKAGVKNGIKFYPALLSNPVTARLVCWLGAQRWDVTCKTRSFSGTSYPNDISGELVYVSADNLISNVHEYLLVRNKENCQYADKIVLSETSNPIAILDAQRRGAKGYIHWWKSSTEDLIHEGTFNPVWGTPNPGEQELCPAIPVVAVNYTDGNKLYDSAFSRPRIEIFTVLQEEVEAVPLVFAEIMPSNGSEEYLLIGSHLDSWYKGVTDNATGNALALSLARLIARYGEKLQCGVKFAWWSGHSNGRYAGSAIYARENFTSLLTNCLAYMNIDMPGQRHATDYSKLACGMELFEPAGQSVHDIIGQTGMFCGPVRGWDQSFQNIGITPYFVWASALPEGHRDRVGDSFMSWWWHTEYDTERFYDSNVMLKDARLYLLAASRLLNGGSKVFRLDSLLSQVNSEILALGDVLTGIANYHDCCQSVAEVLLLAKRRQDENSLPWRYKAYIIKKLNQILYTEKGSHQQDWALNQQFLPGLRAARLQGSGKLDSKGELILKHYLECQVNRIAAICLDIKHLIK